MSTAALKVLTQSLLVPHQWWNFLQSVIQHDQLLKQNKTKISAGSLPDFFWFYLVTGN